MTHEEQIAVFDRLTTRHLRFLTGVLWKLTGDREIFAEAMQYALLSLWRHVEKLEDDKAAGYLYRIALSANTKAWRQRIGRDGDIGLRPAEPGENPETRTHQADLATQVRRTIARLPGKQGRAVVMRYFEQKDYAAIAAALGCTEAAARSHVSKAIARLRSKLAAHAE